MITLLDAKTEVITIQEEAAKIQATINSLGDKKDEKSIESKKRCAKDKKALTKKIRYWKEILDIVQSGIPEQALKEKHNILLVQLRTIQKREPRTIDKESGEMRHYTTDEQKNKEVKKILKKHYDSYNYSHLQNQYRVLSHILRG